MKKLEICGIDFVDFMIKPFTLDRLTQIKNHKELKYR